MKRLLPRSAFARGVSVLVGGTASAQLISVLAMPVITRIYDPNAFGLLAGFAALVAFFTVISAARFDLTIPLPESEQDAANLLILGVLIVTILSSICAFIFLFWSSEIAIILGLQELKKYFWLIPIAIFFGGMYQVFSKWAIRKKDFTAVATTSVIQTLSQVAIQVGGYTLGTVSLLLGQVFGQSMGTSNLVCRALKAPEIRKCSFYEMRRLAIRYKEFPLYSTLTALLNTASLQIAPLIFIALFGSGIAGLYALTLRVLSLPISLIGNAIGNVFLSTAPQAKRDGTLAELVQDLHGKLALIGSVPLVVLLFFGPDLFALVFGEQWRVAGVYSQWMAPWIYLQFQWSPLSILSSVLELQKAAFFAQLFTFVSRFGVLLYAWYFNLNANAAILLFAIMSAVVYLLIMLWFTNRAGVSNLKLILTDVKCLVVATLIITPVALAIK